MDAIIKRNMTNIGGRGTGVPIPGRQAPVIRVSEREMNRPIQEHPSSKQKKEEIKTELILYVNSSKCIHSAHLLHEIQNVHMIPCRVIDASVTTTLPDWLRGTPSLVVENGVYCGDNAFKKLEEIVLEQSQPQHIESNSVESIVSGKKKNNENKGCSLGDAFAPPLEISEEEANAKYGGDMNDILKRAMDNRGKC